MKSKKRRQDYVKPLRLLSLTAIIILVASIIISILFGEFMKSGLFMVIAGFIIFAVLHGIQYRMMTKCKCKKCGYVEIFETKRMLITGVKNKCPKCKERIKVDEVVE